MASYFNVTHDISCVCSCDILLSFCTSLFWFDISVLLDIISYKSPHICFMMFSYIASNVFSFEADGFYKIFFVIVKMVVLYMYVYICGLASALFYFQCVSIPWPLCCTCKSCYHINPCIFAMVFELQPCPKCSKLFDINHVMDLFIACVRWT